MDDGLAAGNARGEGLRVGSKLIAEKLGFTPKRSVEDAMVDLCRAFKAGKLPDSLSDPRYFNVKVMKAQPQAV